MESKPIIYCVSHYKSVNIREKNCFKFLLGPFRHALFLPKQHPTKGPSIEYLSPAILPFLPSDLYMDGAAVSLIAWQPHPLSTPTLQLAVAH